MKYILSLILILILFAPSFTYADPGDADFSFAPSVSLGVGFHPLGDKVMYASSKVYLLDASSDKLEGVKILGAGAVYNGEFEGVFSPAALYYHNYSMSLDWGSKTVGFSFSYQIGF